LPKQLLIGAADAHLMTQRGESSRRRHARREGPTTKESVMNVARGGTLAAPALLLAVACGGSDGEVDGAAGGGSGVEGEAPAPPPIDGEASAGVFVSASKGIPGADG